jgi:DNA-binding NarL/FixJ family response regulator
MSAPRVLVIEDHAAVALALGSVLRSFSGLEHAATVGSAAEARVWVRAHPDRAQVACVDLGLPDVSRAASELGLVRELRETAPGMACVVYTGQSAPSLPRLALEAGATGIVHKGEQLPELLRALVLAARGRRYVSPQFARWSTGANRPLTPRQVEVLQLTAEGLTAEEIAGRLGIGRETVRTHLKQVFGALEVHDRAQAVAVGLRNALIR